MKTCPECKGSKQVPSIPGFGFKGIMLTCPTCKGSGTVEVTCGTCKYFPYYMSIEETPSINDVGTINYCVGCHKHSNYTKKEM